MSAAGAEAVGDPTRPAPSTQHPPEEVASTLEEKRRTVDAMEDASTTQENMKDSSMGGGQEESQGKVSPHPSSSSTTKELTSTNVHDESDSTVPPLLKGTTARDYKGLPDTETTGVPQSPLLNSCCQDAGSSQDKEVQSTFTCPTLPSAKAPSQSASSPSSQYRPHTIQLSPTPSPSSHSDNSNNTPNSSPSSNTTTSNNSSAPTCVNNKSPTGSSKGASAMADTRSRCVDDGRKQDTSPEENGHGKTFTWLREAYHIRPSLPAKEVPIEMRENYIENGYRPPGIGVAVSACSALYLHNETLNFWTHMIPFLYFAYFLFVDQGPWLRLSLITGLGRFPFYGYMVGICTLFGASSFAHLFHCAGQRRWRNVCFVMDYAAISVYGTASAIAYYFYSRPRFRGTFIGYVLSGEGHFLGFTTATAWIATYASCITRLRPTKFCYAIRTAAFALPFVTGSFPAIMRWLHAGAVITGPPAVIVGNATSASASADLGEAVANATASVVMDTGLYRYPQLDYDFSTPYTRHLVMLAGGALINVLKIPERFAPGVFDIFGSSHQWFHLLVFTSIREQFWLMLEEIACHSGMLYARDPDSSMPWGRATIKLSQAEGSSCTIITSTSSIPLTHYQAQHMASSSTSSWVYPWSWNSLLYCALGNPRSSLDTWMALNTIIWMTVLLGSLTTTIMWFGYSYNFSFSALESRQSKSHQNIPSCTNDPPGGASESLNNKSSTKDSFKSSTLLEASLAEDNIGTSSCRTLSDESDTLRQRSHSQATQSTIG